ncbi:hypothetical protein [Mesorhizobium sp.]|uniref:hypothetical protein n=1 Tax=Mesorhizobium sp. TaxID=1871066 RepID=UPI0025C4321F|nr:hypothetical protein [Mesorhizobium sp.]
MPARTFGDWKIRRPALLSAFGHVFVRELRADDGADRIAAGWTDCIPLRTRDSGNVIMAIKQARSRFR